jgi:type III secretion protein J
MERTRSQLLASVLVLLALAGCGGGEVAVLHGLPEADANRVLALLEEHGISGSKTLDNAETGTFSVAVAEDATPRTFALLADHKVSKVDDRRFRDVFGQSQLVVTPGEERALFLEALQGEIAHTLEEVPGVIQARVHLVLPEQDLSGRPTGEAKGSVLLEVQPTPQGESPLEDAEVQALVGHAVEGLDPQSVSVIQKQAVTAAPASPAAADLGLVRVGTLLMEPRAVVALKVFVAVAAALVAALGGMLLWQGRLIRDLQSRLRTERPPAAARSEKPVARIPARSAS